MEGVAVGWATNENEEEKNLVFSRLLFLCLRSDTEKGENRNRIAFNRLEYPINSFQTMNTDTNWIKSQMAEQKLCRCRVAIPFGFNSKSKWKWMIMPWVLLRLRPDEDCERNANGTIVGVERTLGSMHWNCPPDFQILQTRAVMSNSLSAKLALLLRVHQRVRRMLNVCAQSGLSTTAYQLDWLFAYKLCIWRYTTASSSSMPCSTLMSATKVKCTKFFVESEITFMACNRETTKRLMRTLYRY